MKSLEEQVKEVEVKSKNPMEVLMACLEALEIDERGGGPEGIYYTHSSIAGEFLFHNLPRLLIKIYHHYNR